MHSKQPGLPWRRLAVLTLARLVMNTAFRIMYPFAGAFAQGLGLPITAVYRLISIRNLAGFVSPLFGSLPGRVGYRRVLTTALWLMAGGCLLLLVVQNYWALAVMLLVLGVTKVIFDPSLLGYVGDLVPYRQRGRALATTELAWSLALLAGAPLLGLAIQRQGWPAPFAWLAGLALVAGLLVYVALPSRHHEFGGMLTSKALRAALTDHPVILAAGLYLVLIMAANEILLIVYGEWLHSSFGLSLTGLGLSAMVIGGAELIGEVVAGFSTDRFGKRPVIIATGVLSALAYLLLPLLGVTLGGALAGLFVLFLSFEITVVGGVPLLTQIAPAARPVTLAFALAAGSLGRTLGALIGPAAWAAGGLMANGLLAALVTAAGVLVLARWVHEEHETAEHAL